jgi:hypothetical protein
MNEERKRQKRSIRDLFCCNQFANVSFLKAEAAPPYCYKKKNKERIKILNRERKKERKTHRPFVSMLLFLHLERLQ